MMWRVHTLHIIEHQPDPRLSNYFMDLYSINNKGFGHIGGTRLLDLDQPL